MASRQVLSDPAGSPTRNSGLVVELGRRVDLVGSILPELTPAQRYLAILRYVYPDRVGWRQRAGLAAPTFRRLTRAIERELEHWPPGSYDVLLMFQTVFGPGRDHPYTVYTDNIHTLTWRFLPKWAPLSDRQRRARIVLEREVCQGASRIFAMSEMLRQALIDDYGCDPERVIWTGAGSNSIAGTLEGKEYDSRVALFVGINFELKGGQVLLRAWRVVREALPDAELWILGPPAPRGADDEGIRWLGFVRDRAELAEIYRHASLFVLPSFYDAYPHALREAMGQGLPCVGTARGGVPENIADGETGLLVEPGEADELAAAILSILRDPKRASAMGRAGYQEIVDRHTWAHVADRMAPHLTAAAAEGTAI